MGNIEKNPFSLYDFLGHFIPGAFFLIIFFTIFQGCKENNIESVYILKFYDISTYTHLIKKISEYRLGFVYVSFILAAYISGNLLSYLSSQTIEKVLTRTFGYPSEWLLGKCNRDECFIKKYFKVEKGTKIINKIGLIVLFMMVLIITLPIWLFIILGKIFLNIPKYITSSLDTQIISAIKRKEKLLADKLLIDNYEDVSDFHRVIMHYVYMNMEKSEIKTNNYIALYGFFRSITLILCLYFDFLLVVGIYSVFCPLNNVFDLMSFMFIICLGLLCFISFMAFTKFYRRFTLENYMMLLSDITITDINKDCV